MRLFTVGFQFGISILSIHCFLRSRFVGKILIEYPLEAELLQPGMQQPVIRAKLDCLSLLYS